MAKYGSTTGLKGRTFELWVLNRWVLISTSARPHCEGQGKRRRKKNRTTREDLNNDSNNNNRTTVTITITIRTTAEV